jgi:hypothetical protein
MPDYILLGNNRKSMKKVIDADYSKFSPLQWIKVYGVFSSRCDYIITCQGYQLETVLRCMQPEWWDDVVLEPVDEEDLLQSA